MPQALGVEGGHRLSSLRSEIRVEDSRSQAVRHSSMADGEFLTIRQRRINSGDGVFRRRRINIGFPGQYQEGNTTLVTAGDALGITVELHGFTAQRKMNRYVFYEFHELLCLASRIGLTSFS